MNFNKIFFSVLFLLTFTFGYSQKNTSIKSVVNAYIGLKDALVLDNFSIRFKIDVS
jgi:hypothetical protein